MRMLVYSQHFWPENFPINAIARRLSEKGHAVTVATGKPNYPDGEIFPGYTADGAQRETYGDGIEVVRTPMRPRGDSGSLALMRNYLSFICNGLWHFPRLLRAKDFDVILVFASSPLIQAIPAVWLKWRKGAHLAIWAQDLWPESLSATGHIRNRFVLWTAGLVGRWLYAAADTILVQSRAFVEPVARYADRDKIVYYPNSFDAPPQLSAAGEVRNGRFTVLFAGNFGKAQAVEAMVDAASELADDDGIRLVLVGSGSMLDWIAEQKAQRGLRNLELPGRFPPEAMPEMFAGADALLVSLRDEPAFELTIPSKLQAYLAAGKPVIAALRGEGARVVEEAHAGLTCRPGDGAALAQCIRKMAALPSTDRAQMGEGGRRYFETNFEMGTQVGRLVDILEARMGG